MWPHMWRTLEDSTVGLFYFPREGTGLLPQARNTLSHLASSIFLQLFWGRDCVCGMPVCLCVHGCVGACVCTCRPVADLGCLPWALSILLTEAGSLTWTQSSPSPGSLDSLLAPPGTVWPCLSGTGITGRPQGWPALTCVLGIQTLILTLGWQVFYPLSHLPRPTFSFRQRKLRYQRANRLTVTLLLCSRGDTVLKAKHWTQYMERHCVLLQRKEHPHFIIIRIWGSEGQNSSNWK